MRWIGHISVSLIYGGAFFVLSQAVTVVVLAFIRQYYAVNMLEVTVVAFFLAVAGGMIGVLMGLAISLVGWRKAAVHIFAVASYCVLMAAVQACLLPRH